MAQIMLDLKKIKKNVACQTQTEDNMDLENNDFFVYLSETKHASLKYSKSYKDKVLALNIKSSKSFIITRFMWMIFREYINKIENEFNK